MARPTVFRILHSITQASQAKIFSIYIFSFFPNLLEHTVDLCHPTLAESCIAHQFSCSSLFDEAPCSFKTFLLFKRSALSCRTHFPPHQVADATDVKSLTCLFFISNVFSFTLGRSSEEGISFFFFRANIFTHALNLISRLSFTMADRLWTGLWLVFVQPAS